MSIIDNELAQTVCFEVLRFADEAVARGGKFKQVLPGGLYAFGYENASNVDYRAQIDGYHDGQWDVRLFETGASRGAFHYVFDDGTRWEFTDGLMFFATLEDHEETDEDRALDAELAAEQRAEMRMETVCGAYLSGGSRAAVQALNDFNEAY